MSKLYPLLFEPIYKEKIWGGNKLTQLFSRNLPTDNIGESWEVTAHPHGMSVVENGPLKGKSLADLLRDFPQQIYGTHRVANKFPLLVKFIDAHQDLSVQVHPGDDYAYLQGNGEAGKTEMWYVLHAEPGASIIYGLKPGVTRQDFSTAITEKRVVECLNKVVVKPGDVYQLPAGLVHALGAGVVVAEVQQNSDTVYRVYDWDRVDEAGNPRELHIDKALDVINFGHCQRATQTKQNPLVANEYFVVEELNLSDQAGPIAMNDRFHILVNLNDPVEIIVDEAVFDLPKGRSMLIPAECGQYYLRGRSCLLRTYTP